MAQQQSASTVNTTAQQGLMGMPQHQIISAPTVMQMNNIGHQQKPSTTDPTGTIQSGMVNIQSFVGNQQSHQMQQNTQQIITTTQQQIHTNQIVGTTSVPVAPNNSVQQTTFSSSNASGTSATPSKGNASTSGIAPNQPVGAAQSSSDGTPQLLSKARLMDLVRDVDPTVQLDEEVEDMLLSIAECFVETIGVGASKIAKHRQMSTIGVSDVQLYLEQAYNIWIPGFGTDELRPFKRSTVTEAHKQRMSLIRKARKN